MGEMIKFGIKMALTIACAVALVAAIGVLFNLISSFTINTSSSYVGYIRDLGCIMSLVLPFNVSAFFGVITSLFAFKVAYWAADKMIQFISAMG